MGWGDIKDGMNTETYKGFRIVPCRTCLSGTDGTPERWVISVEIQRETSTTAPKVFTAKGKYASTEQDAIRLSLEYGKNIIDGAVASQSVSEL